MTVTINGTGPIVADASGNVGIGTSTPTQKLDVTGNIKTGGSLYVAGSDSSIVRSGGNPWVMISSNTGYGSAGMHLKLDSTSGSASLFVFDNTTTRFYINSSGHVHMPSQPYLRAIVASGTSNLSFTGTGPYVIPFNSIVDQVGSNFNTSTYRFTAPVAGAYMVSAAVEGNGITSAWVNLFLRINGSNFAGTYVSGRNVAYDKIHTDGVIRCSAGDYIDVAILLNSSGGYLELLPGDTRNSLFITYLH